MAGLRFRKTIGAGPARVTLGRRGATASAGAGRLRASRRGLTIRLLPGLTYTFRPPTTKETDDGK